MALHLKNRKKEKEKKGEKKYFLGLRQKTKLWDKKGCHILILSNPT